MPAFMRFGGNTAYVEGWALYSETLGYDMGLYKDPCSASATLNDEMLRAMRLVVDTGIHTKGWTRDQSIKYMLDHSGESKTDATAEVERYIAIPSQATAYKIGALTIQRLRDKAKAALGPSSTSANSMRRCSTAARCRWRSWRRRSTAGSRPSRLASSQVYEGGELVFAFDKAGLVTSHGRVSGQHALGDLVELFHARAVEQQQQVVGPGKLVAELDLIERPGCAGARPPCRAGRRARSAEA